MVAWCNLRLTLSNPGAQKTSKVSTTFSTRPIGNKYFCATFILSAFNWLFLVNLVLIWPEASSWKKIVWCYFFLYMPEIAIDTGEIISTLKNNDFMWKMQKFYDCNWNFHSRMFWDFVTCKFNIIENFFQWNF